MHTIYFIIIIILFIIFILYFKRFIIRVKFYHKICNIKYFYIIFNKYRF